MKKKVLTHAPPFKNKLPVFMYTVGTYVYICVSYWEDTEAAAEQEASSLSQHESGALRVRGYRIIQRGLRSAVWLYVSV